MFVYYNPNPCGKAVGDCVIRAISALENISWEQAYVSVCAFGFAHCDMPSSNHVWMAYLKSRGYEQKLLPKDCPACYTVRDFCYEHPYGCFLLATGTHAVTAIDGCWWDAWDSGSEVVDRYFTKEEW